RRPARLDDLLEVSVELRASGRASLTVNQAAWRADELLAEGEIRIGCVDAGTFRPQRIPTAIVSALR
ncbi:MAG: 4-hydroxybenzoyl-CoA thioesterase, partial [Burkholderiales bacterium]|nr:4-hydroxybenzoyl-CoA thioesterase [Burkholderiales bacterium]